MKAIHKIPILMLVLCLLLSGCSNSTSSTDASNDTSKSDTVLPDTSIDQNVVSDESTIDPQSDPPEETAYIYTNMNAGCSTPDFTPIEIGYSGPLSLDIFTDMLSQITGLDFYLTSSSEPDGVHIDWAQDSTLIANLDERKQLDEFYFYDSDTLRWFMMDSLWKTITQNYGTVDVFYSMNGGEDLVLDELSPVREFPADIPYMGSAFYCAHDNYSVPDVIDIDTAITMVRDTITQRGDIAPVIMQTEDDIIDGVHAYTFSAGSNSTDGTKYTATYYYAVTDDGDVFYLDFLRGYDWIYYGIKN